MPDIKEMTEPTLTIARCIAGIISNKEVSMERSRKERKGKLL